MARAPTKKSAADKGPPPSAFTPPEERRNFVGHESMEARVSELIARGDLTNGWLLAGPPGVGKATFAFRIARALLNQPAPAADALGLGLDEAPTAPKGLDAHNESRAANLIAAGAHPDLFVARRQWNDKTQKFAQDISVDVIRTLTQALAQTPSMGNWRVAIVDTADEMNRNAANALLKVLEEPPARTTLLLLSARPGRLLATIRSRCRRLDLKPVETEAVETFLGQENAAQGEEAKVLAAAAKGRPGFALALAAADGATAISAVDAFVRGAARGGAPDAVIAKLTARGADDAWRLFKDLLAERLTRLVISAGDAGEGGVADLAAARDAGLDLLGRGDALNLDRGPLLSEIARIIKPLSEAGRST